MATTVVRVELLILSGQADGALLAGAHVLDASRGDQHAELCLRLAAAAVAARRWSVAASYVARAGRPADGRSLVLLAESAHGAAAIGEATRLADQAVARARADGPAETLCAALCVRARVARLDSPTNARIAFGEAAQVSSEHGLKAWRVEALIGLGTLELLADEASPSLLEAGRAAAEAGLIGKAAQVEAGPLRARVDHPGPDCARACGTAADRLRSCFARSRLHLRGRCAAGYQARPGR